MTKESKNTLQKTNQVGPPCCLGVKRGRNLTFLYRLEEDFKSCMGFYCN
jgi:hypothetical protein